MLAKYREPSRTRSIVEIAVTLLPFAALWAAAWALLSAGHWIGLLPAVLAAGFLVRLFMIQHDCGHGAFFRKRAANDWIGRIIGVLTLTPYDVWRRAHSVHHANSGNLDKRGIGDIDTLTVQEYRNRSPLRRLLYRLYRHPLVMFGVGPAWLFLLEHRLPFGQMRAGRMPWVSTMATNAAVTVLAGVLIWSIGLVPFLLVQGPITLIAASIGVWLFYVQHQFDGTSWARGSDWTLHEAALKGSSHYDLPRVLRWMTANIGVHHVHHLSSRVPYYRLQQVLRDYPGLAGQSRLTLRDSLRSVRLALWDESRHRLVSFREAARA